MLKIKKYPEFEPLTLRHKDEIERFVSKFPPYSDFNFTSLFVWDSTNSLTICKLYGNLVIRFRGYLDEEYFYTFLGKRKVTKTAKTLLKRAEEEGILPELCLIPEIVAKRVKTKKLLLKEDRDQHDYILSVKDQMGMTGQKNHSKKRRINKLLGSGMIISDKTLKSFHDDETKSDIKNLYEIWAQGKNEKGYDANEAKNEMLALHKLLSHSSLNAEIFYITVDNRLAAYTIGEIVNNKYFIGHFEKADSNIEGLFQYLRHTVATNLDARGITYYNIEQDLGVPGLRESKEHLRPVTFLKKYTIRAKHDSKGKPIL